MICYIDFLATYYILFDHYFVCTLGQTLCLPALAMNLKICTLLQEDLLFDIDNDHEYFSNK